MLNFVWPWMFALLPLPILLRWLFRPAENQMPALKVSAFQFQGSESQSSAVSSKKLLPLLLLAICWLSLVAAAARPTWIGEPIALPADARDLMLAVDISKSMESEDMSLISQQANRLDVVKKVVSEFVERRTGDRMGLIVFGDQAYLQTPLTFDRKTLNKLLLETRTRFAGLKTAIGDAIGLAVKRLKDRPAEQRTLILLTDGANTAGEVEPMQAAQLAAQENIRIYTIGVGADSQTVRDMFFTRTINPSADLDEETLQAIADSTGGQYFRARNPQELEQIYLLLDQLEPVEQEAETLRPTKALFFWPLGICLIGSMLLALFRRGD